MPATVGVLKLPQQGSHAHGKEGENETIRQAQEQGEIEEQGKDEETRTENSVPIEEARDQGEEESRQASAQARGGEDGETEEAARSAQGRAESCAGPATGSCPYSRADDDERTRTGAQSSARTLHDGRRRRDRPADWHDRMNGSVLIDMPNR